MSAPSIVVTDKLHKVLKEFKEKEGISIRKQIEFLVKESPRYKEYTGASK